MSTEYKLVYSICPHGVGAISLDGDGGGVRLTRIKCCGRWDTQDSFPMDARALRELANEAECAASELEECE